jgi:hypothetical protein
MLISSSFLESDLNVSSTTESAILINWAIALVIETGYFSSSCMGNVTN